MILSIKEGELMLPDDFSFEIERNNPFFSEDGTASIPVELPTTGDMRSKLGFPDRFNRAYRFVKKKPAVLRHQVFNKRCSLIIDSYGGASGITASIALDESQMYAELQEKNLKEIFKDEVYSFPGSDTPEKISKELYVLYSYEGYLQPEVIAFPVGMNLQEDGSCIVANLPDSGNFVCSRRDITIGDETESVPEGYGVIPFIMLKHLLEKTFSLCGYNVARNDLAERPFVDIVVLNNCIDALCGQTAIRYRDMVPSITFGQLIEWLKNKFCAAVYVKDRDVNIVMFEKLCNDLPDMDLSGYASGDYTLSYPEPMQLKLDCATGIDGAGPAFESLQALSSGAKRITNAEDWWEMGARRGIYFIEPTGQTLRRRVEYNPETGESRWTDEPLGSSCIPFDNKLQLVSKSFSADDEFVPSLILNSYCAMSNAHSAIPYIGERFHNHTSVNSESEEGIEPAEQKIMVCYCLYGDMYYRGGNSQPFDNQELARQFYNLPGDQMRVNYPPLTPYGMYDFCWRRYDAMIINSAPTASMRMDLPVSDLLSLDLSRPKLFKGQKALVTSYKMELSNTSIRCISLNLQFLPSYKDAISSESQIPVPERYRLVWSLYCEAAGEDYREYGTQYPLYTMDDAPLYAPTYAGQIALKRRNKGYTTEGDEYAAPKYNVFEEYFIAILQPL